MLSRDLRHFDVPLRAARDAAIMTPLGLVETETAGPLQRVTLTLDPSLRSADVRYFYYSEWMDKSLVLAIVQVSSDFS